MCRRLIGKLHPGAARGSVRTMVNAWMRWRWVPSGQNYQFLAALNSSRSLKLSVDLLEDCEKVIFRVWDGN